MNYRLPGIRFETRPPELSEVLPRMDVAAFIGFASSGPIDTPVPIEDVSRFRDIFGDDVPLAWNRDKQRMEYSYLGPSVEAFFRNGGRRCWIVRVADHDAKTNTFLMPGMIRTDGTRLEAVEAAARCPGSWSDDLQVGTVLQTYNLSIDISRLQTDTDNIPVFMDANEWRLDITSTPIKLYEGDLLKVTFREKNDILFLFMDDFMPTENGIRLWGKSGFWFFNQVVSSPQVDSIIGEMDNGYLYPLSQTNTLDMTYKWPLGSPVIDPPYVALLRFDIVTWRKRVIEKRISNLAFHEQHPRFWGNLPGDSELFQSTVGKKTSINSPETDRLIMEANEPRFPIAGPEIIDNGKQSKKDPWFYLPLEMSNFPDVEMAVSPDIDRSLNKIERDGLGSFKSDLFTDKLLSSVYTGSLLSEAKQRYYMSDKPIRFEGMYGLLPIDEVTLVAVPDAVHRQWNRQASPAKELLTAPFLNAIDESSGKCFIHWSEVENVTSYVIQQDSSPEFDNPVLHVVRGENVHSFGSPQEIYRRPDNFMHITVSADCPKSFYFRVRAERHGEVSPWSNTRARILPPSDFLQCEMTQPDTLELWLEKGVESPTAGDFLFWTAADTSEVTEVIADVFEVQKANNIEFSDATQIYCGTQQKIQISRQADVIQYYRVRAWRDEPPGPWSNTVCLASNTLSLQTLENIDDYSDNHLLDVHRALIRFCAARGDMIAVLSLPHHYQEQDVLEHLAGLMPSGIERQAGMAGQPDNRSLIPMLTSGEQRALSYAALYHPWVAVQAQSSAQNSFHLSDILFVPPDGSIVGSIARRTIEQGVWSAPANDPLIGVLALEPDISQEEMIRLMDARVNVVFLDTRGFLVLNADTLSMDDDLRSIGVRRLLILLRRLAVREGNTYVFEPNDDDFHDTVTHSFNRFLSDMYIRGAFAGDTAESAYRVVADSSVNTRQSLDLGRFIVELRVAPSRPMKFINVRLVQTGPGNLQVQEL